jgi:hypothetical protein
MNTENLCQLGLATNKFACAFDRVRFHSPKYSAAIDERQSLATDFFGYDIEMEIDFKMAEATSLAARFKGIKNRARFARDFKVPGGDAMIYQHINGLKPIGLDAALAYARGFGCSLADISNRLATEVQNASKKLPSISVQKIEATSDVVSRIFSLVLDLSEADQKYLLQYLTMARIIKGQSDTFNASSQPEDNLKTG